MSDNINENREQKTSSNMDKDPKNIANQFLKNQNTLDLGSMMQLASTLLNNDVIMNSVTEQLSKNKTIAAAQSSKASEKPETVHKLTSNEKLVTNSNDISELKEELRGLATLSKKIENLTNEISELIKVLKKGKEQELDHNTEKL